MTSVKEFRVTEPATTTDLGRGRFVFTDAYSVFDWGEMPDPIPQKGASLCTMGAFNFELLEAAGVPTHYRGIVDPDASTDTDRADADTDRVDADTDRVDADTDRTDAARVDAEPSVVPLESVSTPPTQMAIDLTQVPDLPYRGEEAGYDYETYHRDAGENFLVPLEVVFRNTVPVGSSLRRRTTPEAFDLPFAEWPAEVVDLPEPVVEFSTKYEEQDRYLSREEADSIAGVADIDALEALARDVNRVVTERATETGFVHEDGKIECLYFDGELRVADVVGTFDENRFAYEGQAVSKEVVRQWYKRNDPDWVQAVSTAKTDIADLDVDDWRTICKETPISLPQGVVDAVSGMYAAGANAYTGRDRFDAPDIAAAVRAVQDL